MVIFCAAANGPAPEAECPLAPNPVQAHLQLGRLGLADRPDAAPLRADSPYAAPDEFVVHFDSHAAAALRAAHPAGVDLLASNSGVQEVDALSLRSGITALRPLHPSADATRDALRGLPDMTGWYIASIDPRVVSVGTAMQIAANDPLVRSVETIGLHPIDAVPNDPSYASQWFLNQASDKDIDAPEAWDIENGAPSIIVAVLDTGVRYFHKDLGGVNASSSNPTAANGNMWRNLAEVNGVAGVDDDGNGYIDDWIGWDFVSGAISTCWSGEDCTGADNDPRDFNGHGTHCAGIVAAMNNNGYAVASAGGGFGGGANTAAGDGVKVMGLKIGHSSNYGGQQVGFVSMAYAASALYYAANNGAKIASCSWGSSNSGGIAAALDYFVASGGLVFKAAGNSNVQTADYMCSRSDVYSVVATDQADKKASFSSYGTWADISAPGVSILSTYHVYNQPASDYVAYLDGTSMATPLVASCAAVVWSKNPTWNRTQVWDAVRLNADPIDALNPSFTGKLGSGRVNLQKALGGGAPPPPPPTGPFYLFSFSGSPSLPGVGTVSPEDIVSYDAGSNSWSLYFDGSDVGLSGKTIAAFTRLSSGALLFSFTASSTTIAGLTGGPSGTTITYNDVVQFTPTSLGATTAGSWSFLFDGSDVGLTTSAESIDALAVSTAGNLVLSTSGTPSVTGLSGLADEDIISFSASAFGSATSGTWSWLFDGSDVGLSTTDNEDVDASFIDASGAFHLSTLGSFSVTGASGGASTIVKFTPTSTGSATAGSFTTTFNATTAGVPSGANATGFAILP